MSKSSNQSIFNTKHLYTDLKKKSLRGGAVTLTSQGIKFLLQLGSTMVLARILTPQDYGMMAMVVAITGLAKIFLNLGLSTATIQRAEINHAQVSTLFWINTGMGVAIMIVVACLSPAIAWFYKKPELVWVSLALSSNFLINGLAVQHQALLNRQMRFLAIAKIQISAMLIAISLAILSALQGFGYWALVIHNITISVITLMGIWLTVGWIPGIPQRDSDVLSMVKFGADLVGFNIVNYFSRNLDNILIGRFHGSSALGFYSKAFQLLMMPITNLRNPLTRVAMPAMSRLQNEPEQYRNYYMRFVSILAFVSMPLVAFLFVCSDEIIHFLLGPQWSGASELFKILALIALIQPVASTRGLVLLSTGKSRKYLILGIAGGIYSGISFIVGLPWGPKGVATAYAIFTYIMILPLSFFSFQNTPVSVRDFLMSIYKPFTASLIMGGVCFYLLTTLEGLSDIIVLSICFTISLPIYFITIIVVSGGGDDLRAYYSYGKIIIQNK